MQELGVLEPGVSVIHHDTKHGLRTVHDILLLLFKCDLCLLVLVFHHQLILPILSLLLQLHLLKLLFQHVFFHFHFLLSLHPLVMMEHLHLLL